MEEVVYSIPKTVRSTVWETFPATLSATQRYCPVSLALALSSTSEPSDVTRCPRTGESPRYHVTSGWGVPRTGQGRLIRLFSMMVVLDMTSDGRYGASVNTVSYHASIAPLLAHDAMQAQYIIAMVHVHLIHDRLSVTSQNMQTDQTSVCNFLSYGRFSWK